jgi:ABC-2 type transport system permease protein
VKYSLLLDGAERPDGFWRRYALARALERAQIFGIVAAVPVGLLAGLYWYTEAGKDAVLAGVAMQIVATVLASALLFVICGALLDLVCETSRFGALLQREYQAYFHTPVPYLVMVLFTLASGYFFHSVLVGTEAITLRFAFQSVSSFLIFLVPLLTIRSFAEERSSGTVEPLLTAPVTETQVVAGKFFGAMTFYFGMLVPTLAYFVILRVIGREIGRPEIGPMVGGYIGLVLFGGFHVAIGIFASTLTQDSILGAFLAFVMTLFFWVIQPLMQAKRLLDLPAWDEAAEYMAPISHLEPFLKGLLSPVDIIYFVSFTLFFLFLSVRIVEYRKWR